MADAIVYTLVAKGGGVDGMDHTDKGGKVTRAYLDRKGAESDANIAWNTIAPIVVDLEAHAKEAVRNMDPITILALASNPDVLAKRLPPHLRHT